MKLKQVEDKQFILFLPLIQHMNLIIEEQALEEEVKN
jgi:hypothetical protein